MAILITIAFPRYHFGLKLEFIAIYGIYKKIRFIKVQYKNFANDYST